MTKMLTLWILDDLWKTLKWLGMTLKWLGITWLTLGWCDIFLIDFGMVLEHMTLGWLLIDIVLALGWIMGLLWDNLIYLKFVKKSMSKSQSELY